MNDNTLLFNAVAAKSRKIYCLDSADSGFWGSIESLPCVNSSSRCRFYSQQANAILKNITELRDLILGNQAPYILSSTILPLFGESMENLDGSKPKMTADGCKFFDEFSDVAINQCSNLIQSLQGKIVDDRTLRLHDELRHLRLVTHLLSIYLKNVCSIVVHMRVLRKARLERKKKFCRLRGLVDMWEEILLEKNRTDFCYYSHLMKSNKYQLELEEMKIGPNCEGEVTLNLDLEQRLQAENELIFQRLTSANADIQQIGSRLVEIQELQDLFSEKILEQDRDIDVVNTKTEHTLNTLEDANEFVRGVLSNKASRRIIALFSLIVLSFTLLFVDWYNL